MTELEINQKKQNHSASLQDKQERIQQLKDQIS
jgi:hypothetical protein